jgi:CspA family cold shock protein
METGMEGRVKWYDAPRGFGFLYQDNGPDVFVHHRGVADMGDRTLQAGDRVLFDVEVARRGPRAINVRVIEEA